MQEEYMYENCRDNKYFLICLDTEVGNNDSITKIWLFKVMSEKRGWQVTNSPPLNPPLRKYFFNANVEYCESVRQVRFSLCESVVNNLKTKKLPAQVNRNRFDLILARRYWNCSFMENLRCLNSTVSALMMK